MTNGTHSIWQRLAEQVERTRVPKWASNQRVMNRLSYLPPIPWLGRSRRTVWSDARQLADKVPPELRTTPGIPRDAAAEDAAFRELGPIPLWSDLYPGGIAYVREQIWRSLVLMAPRVMRAYRRLRQQRIEPSRKSRQSPARAEGLTEATRAAASAIGLSTIGIAPYDPNYTFAPYQDSTVGDRVIVCVLEQDWEATQTIPSLRAELVVQRTYAELSEMAGRLASHLRDLGYRARADVPFGTAVAIHYGVASGLGQLGLNGQLLTPQTGSRCRLSLIHTDAPLDFDAPVDYGIPSICDNCRACVRRCPVGAIPVQRRDHRGVYKTKIATDRCMPAVAQADGCGVCQKVCPIQRYGLEPVLDHWTETGLVLGVGTDELEGYIWPLDGVFYPADARPRDAKRHEFLHPEGADLAPVTVSPDGSGEQLDRLPEP